MFVDSNYKSRLFKKKATNDFFSFKRVKINDNKKKFEFILIVNNQQIQFNFVAKDN